MVVRDLEEVSKSQSIRKYFFGSLSGRDKCYNWYRREKLCQKSNRLGLGHANQVLRCMEGVALNGTMFYTRGFSDSKAIGSVTL